MTQTNQLAVAAPQENRMDRIAGIGVSMAGGLAVRDMAQAIEVSRLMAASGAAVPNHLRNNPGACMAIAIQAWEWSINPFALANKSYVVNDRMAYESALYHAVVLRRAPIIGRLKIAYSGDGATRTCKVSASVRTEDGKPETVEYESPKFGTINPKNSPLWKNDPDQQLFYFSVRAFARRHFPDVMMGVYTVDEMQDSPPQQTVIEARQSRRLSDAPEVNARLDAAKPAPMPQGADGFDGPVIIQQQPSDIAAEPRQTQGDSAAQTQQDDPADPLAGPGWYDVIWEAVARQNPEADPVKYAAAIKSRTLAKGLLNKEVTNDVRSEWMELAKSGQLIK